MCAVCCQRGHCGWGPVHRTSGSQTPRKPLHTQPRDSTHVDNTARLGSRSKGSLPVYAGTRSSHVAGMRESTNETLFFSYKTHGRCMEASCTITYTHRLPRAAKTRPLVSSSLHRTNLKKKKDDKEEEKKKEHSPQTFPAFGRSTRTGFLGSATAACPQTPTRP
jgi:hypothetical protein